MMNATLDHIAVCICTYKRPALLKRLLDMLERQTTRGLFCYSIVIADNDINQSAREIVSNYASYALTSLRGINYCVEPRQNIALARNMAIKSANGDFIALIDDDEIPNKNWLYMLYKTCNDKKADGVLGPVLPYFEHDPPQWVKKANFFTRPRHQTGYRLDWTETRSGNVLFKKEIIKGIMEPFRTEFGTGGEDIDFFRRMMDNGNIFVWCEEAAVHELVTPARCRRLYQLKMALLRGGNSLKYLGSRRSAGITKSLAALPIYGLALPLLFVLGDHLFMSYLVKFCDHAGKILKLIGINPVKAREQ
jgi:succinoglycan biosynthesis protein ExoM